MLQQQYEQCLDILTVIFREAPNWMDCPDGIFEDYMVELYDQRRALTALGVKVYRRLSAIPKGTRLTRDMCADIISELYDKEDGVNPSAYFFTVKLFSDLLCLDCEIYVDELGDELADDPILPRYPSLEAVPRDERLMYFKNRLLDFSRTNPLVHFKPLKTNIPLVYPNAQTLLDALRRQDRVYLDTWARLGVARILRCETCGRHFLRKYDKSTADHALACPDCDQKKRTKQAKPLPEGPLVVSERRPHVCRCQACGEESFITRAVIEEYPLCTVCGAELPLPSYPVFSEELLRVTSGDVSCLSGVDDRRSLQSADSLIKYATQLKTNYGLHSLYLACGFLHWHSVGGQTYNSPLLLCRIGLAIDKSRGHAYIYLDDTDDEVITVNHTLRKMLENYSESLSIALPEYRADSGVDAYITELLAVLKRFPETAAWEVSPSVYIGKFYYHKLQLEKDFDDNFDLYAAHPLVKKLCGVDSVDRTGELPTELEGTLEADAGEDFKVLDADSSQESVVEAARSGKNFILQGPPGTGKSQTITNIIADAVGRGKTVLFVTEKASARNIISDNFHSCVVEGATGGRNLTDYILNAENVAAKKGNGEINKTDLRKFLNDSFTHAEPLPWRERAPEHRLFEERLRRVYEYLSANDTGDGSVMHLIEEWLPLADCETIDFPGANMDEIELSAVTDFIQNYYAASEGQLDYTRHELYGYTERNLLCPSLGNIQELSAALRELEEESDRLQSRLGYTAERSTVEAMRRSLELPAALADLPELCLYVLAQNRSAALMSPVNHLRTALEYTKKRLADRAVARKLPYFDLEQHVDVDQLLRADIAALRDELETYSFFASRVGRKYNRLCTRIQAPLTTPPKKNSYRSCQDTLAMLETCRETQREKLAFEVDFPTDAATYGSAFKGWDTDLDTVIAHLIEGIAFFTSRDTERLRGTLGHILDAIVRGEDYRALVRTALDRMESAMSAVTEGIAGLEGVFDHRVIQPMTMTLPELSEYLSRFDMPMSRVSRWAKLQMLLFSARDDRNISRILKTVIVKHPATAAEAVNAISKAYYRARIMASLNDRADLFPFLSRDGFEGNIAEYRRHDALRLRAAPVHLYNRLLGLKNQVYDSFYTKHRRKDLIRKYVGISIKELIRSHWEQIRAVTPCIMMSPLNVSQYLDISVNFDLVIFDEASQIFLEESLASVVRGQQLIISGDEQQLPPFDFARATSSFGTANSDFEEEFSSGESILTAALRSSIDSHSLRWHYRSADESLIYFSNRHFYGNTLVTFPAARHDPDDGVFYHYVEDGCYMSARERTNMPEARRVVELLYREITSETHGHHSIGVVAFNVTQAEAIEQAWLRFLSTNQDTRVDDWIKRQDELHEPLVFCNLDTIQGDERDTMIISTTYGENDEGIFRLSFLGPVRQENGKKRINVAITRAKRRMLVVTSLRAHELEACIAAGSGRNEGALTLMEFLRYAESFKNRRRPVSDEKANTPLLRSICGLLDEAGIDYDLHVGLSEYKVQIGIKRPRNLSALAPDETAPTVLDPTEITSAAIDPSECASVESKSTADVPIEAEVTEDVPDEAEVTEGDSDEPEVTEGTDETSAFSAPDKPLPDATVPEKPISNAAESKSEKLISAVPTPEKPLCASDVTVRNSSHTTASIQAQTSTDTAGEDYVLGILTDEQGLSGQSVRDLARHRDFVLSGKYAWSLYHVYMLPWFWNYESEGEALLGAIRRAIDEASSDSPS